MANKSEEAATKKVVDELEELLKTGTTASSQRDYKRQQKEEQQAKEAEKEKSAQILAKAMLDEQDRRTVQWHHDHLGSLSDAVFRDTVRKLYGFDP